MITAIILSKDRAAQLHLLLESIQKINTNLFDIKVIYESSNDVFEEGYKKTQAHFFLKDKYGLNFPIRWYKREEETLSLDILKRINRKRDLTCILSDEDIFFSRCPSFKKIITLFRNHDITALSFRLGSNTVIQNPYSINEYFVDKPDSSEIIDETFIKWDASDVKPFTNFAMPLSNHGHVYTSKLLDYVLRRTKIGDIEGFEYGLQQNLYSGLFHGDIPPSMACLEESVLITNSAFKVSDAEPSQFGTTDFGLNDRYLSGMKIDYNFFKFKGVSKPFQQFITRFKREDNLQYSR